MQSEWEQIRGEAEKRGLLHNDGTFADPPSGFGSGVLNPPQGGSVIGRPPCANPSIITEYGGYPVPRVDPKLIGQEQR